MCRRGGGRRRERRACLLRSRCADCLSVHPAVPTRSSSSPASPRQPPTHCQSAALPAPKEMIQPCVYSTYMPSLWSRCDCQSAALPSCSRAGPQQGPSEWGASSVLNQAPWGSRRRYGAERSGPARQQLALGAPAGAIAAQPKRWHAGGVDRVGSSLWVGARRLGARAALSPAFRCGSTVPIVRFLCLSLRVFRARLRLRYSRCARSAIAGPAAALPNQRDDPTLSTPPTCHLFGCAAVASAGAQDMGGA